MKPIAILKQRGSASGGGLVSVSNRSINISGAGTQLAAYQLHTSGDVKKGDNGAYVVLEAWKLAGVVGDYDVRVTETGGSGLTGGSLTNTWLNLSAIREWTLEEPTSGGTSTATFLVEVRLAASPFTILDSASISLAATQF